MALVLLFVSLRFSLFFVIVGMHAMLLECLYYFYYITNNHLKRQTRTLFFYQRTRFTLNIRNRLRFM